MKANVGGFDKILRIVVGLGIIVGFGLTGNYVIAALGVIPVVTAFINWCPAYIPFGISSAKKAD